jgi:hypothetical protein
MRSIRVSQTYLAALHEQLAFGQSRFSDKIVEEKRRRVSQTIQDVLALYPAIGARDNELGVYFHPVSQTPFVLLYDFDDVELRIHLIVHRRADRSRVDLTSVEWR